MLDSQAFSESFNLTGKLKTGLCILEQGARFVMLSLVFLVTVVTNKLLQCHFGLLLSHDHPNCMRQDVVWSSRPRETQSFLFLPFLNNCTDSCHILTKLLVQ